MPPHTASVPQFIQVLLTGGCSALKELLSPTSEQAAVPTGLCLVLPSPSKPLAHRVCPCSLHLHKAAHQHLLQKSPLGQASFWKRAGMGLPWHSKCPPSAQPLSLAQDRPAGALLPGARPRLPVAARPQSCLGREHPWAPCCHR